MTQIDILFDGAPSHVAPRFVEVESPPGHSIRFGEWIAREDGYWALRFHLHSVADIEGAIGFLNRPDREHVLDRLGILCVECGTKFTTPSSSCPICPTCNSSDIEVRDGL